MITVIIFDLGGVLFTNGTKKFIDMLVAKYELDKAKVADVMDGKFGSLYREAKISRDEFWQKCLEELGIQASIDELESEWINGYELILGTRDLIHQLSKKYKIYFLSDNVKARVDAINNKFHFLSWFDGGVFSHEVGVRKPHSEIYQIALTKAGVAPEEVVFIDDKMKMLSPAKAMGIKTFLFESPEKLREDLKRANFL